MEQVYVVPASLFPPAQEALIPLEEALLQAIEQKGFFLERARAEEDPTYRQIIPYALVRYRERYFLMRRTQGGGEARLYGRYTLGVGGHINPQDAGGNPLLNGLRRELAEEVGVQRYSARPVGFIVSDSSPVSRVHAGVVFVVEAAEAPRVMEGEKLEGRLASLPEVEEVYEGLEGWSQILAAWLAALKKAERRP
ncbi:NUDIX hydrolase [Meiothermus taiwanensis]|jgi:predicted NUDIX family phosphoesterase|uniref:NUDIX hydrolase n=1 Tax=Meiothermus taiwanensis WR-220 TaxID=1339250 RepID=A0ABN5M301_9DEIN|nr:NUDIX hydrolase [Meiothermus taiwanensis]AWR86750.1 NUDIX hydrolase [Meiothermus taiwanensis WR-220]KIQ55318.1 NUDIX hydrolase [Meiothermus taiwanensis]KZK14931.1 NUDIX hydrolase [Meiothermus taiwanensis]